MHSESKSCPALYISCSCQSHAVYINQTTIIFTDYGLNYPNQIADTGNNSEKTTNDTPPEVIGFDNSSMEGKNSSNYHHDGIQSPIKSVKDFTISGTATPNYKKVATTASSSITRSKNKT